MAKLLKGTDYVGVNYDNPLAAQLRVLEEQPLDNGNTLLICKPIGHISLPAFVGVYSNQVMYNSVKSNDGSVFKFYLMRDDIRMSKYQRTVDGERVMVHTVAASQLLVNKNLVEFIKNHC